MKYTEADDEEDFTAKEKIQYSLLGIAVLGGSFYFGRKLIRTTRATGEEKKTYEEGSAATFAKQIKMAFDNDMWYGWGTDEEGLRKTIRTIPSKDEFRKVINSYQALYNKSMMKDMQEELTATEYNEVLAIISGKPDRYGRNAGLPVSTVQFVSWAKRLKAAFDITYGPFPGTDEDAVKAVFMEIPTQAVFSEVAKAYGREYGRDLIKDIKSELEFWEYSTMMQLINAKPKR